MAGPRSHGAGKRHPLTGEDNYLTASTRTRDLGRRLAAHAEAERADDPHRQVTDDSDLADVAAERQADAAVFADRVPEGPRSRRRAAAGSDSAGLIRAVGLQLNPWPATVDQAAGCGRLMSPPRTTRCSTVAGSTRTTGERDDDFQGSW
jgi:hypothetical protein